MEVKLKIPILFYPNEDAKLNELGIESINTEIRIVILFVIDRIEQYYRNNAEHTLIVSNGDEMVCPLKINEVEKLIDESLKVKQLSKYLQLNN
jgi:hypothetical protein